MKELYIQAHEELIAEFLEVNPMISWSLAYEITAEHVQDRLADNYAAMADQWDQEGLHG